MRPRSATASPHSGHRRRTAPCGPRNGLPPNDSTPEDHDRPHPGPSIPGLCRGAPARAASSQPSCRCSPSPAPWRAADISSGRPSSFGPRWCGTSPPCRCRTWSRPRCIRRIRRRPWPRTRHRVRHRIRHRMRRPGRTSACDSRRRNRRRRRRSAPGISFGHRQRLRAGRMRSGFERSRAPGLPLRTGQRGPERSRWSRLRNRNPWNGRRCRRRRENIVRRSRRRPCSRPDSRVEPGLTIATISRRFGPLHGRQRSSRRYGRRRQAGAPTPPILRNPGRHPPAPGHDPVPAGASRSGSACAPITSRR